MSIIRIRKFEDLCSIISQRQGISASAVYLAITGLVAVITEELANGRAVHIMNLGRFSPMKKVYYMPGGPVMRTLVRLNFGRSFRNHLRSLTQDVPLSPSEAVNHPHNPKFDPSSIKSETDSDPKP